MKIQIISGNFPPECSGVGDHTHFFATQLRSLGHEVGVIAGHHSPSPVTGIEVTSFPHPWNFSQLLKMTQKIRKFQPQIVYVQYAPASIAPKTFGIHILFPFWLLFIRLSGVQTCVYFHELNYPVRLNPRGLFIGIPHFIQLFFLALFTSISICSTELFVKQLKRLTLGVRKVNWLPIGSNIVPSAVADHAELKKRYSIPSHQKIVLHFGGDHPTHLYSFVFSAFKKIQLTCPGEFCLVLIGTSQRPTEASDVFTLGYLSAQEVSAFFKMANLVLAPFLDGISTRRGSAMAAFAHGKPVLTTLGWSSAGVVPWDQICEATDAADESAFVSKATQLIQTPERLARLSIAAEKYYHQQFDWLPIAKNFLQFLDQDSARGVAP